MEEKLLKNKLGKTDLLVTPLCWGCAPLGNMPEDFGYGVPEEQALRTLAEAFNGPVNFFDTARIYGDSELRIGKALQARGGQPEGVIIATKADRNTVNNEFSAKQMRESIEESLQRLQVDSLPLVYLHDPEHDPRYQKDKNKFIEAILAKGGAVEELEKLKEEGLIQNIGISGGPIDMLIEFIETKRFDVVLTHNRWNLIYQTAGPLLEKAHELRLGIVNAAIYASGILVTGTQKKSRFVYGEPSPTIVQRVRKLEEMCKKYNIPLGAAALKFSLRDSRIHSTVIGISNPEEIAEAQSFLDVSIPNEFWEEADLFALKEGDPEM